MTQYATLLVESKRDPKKAKTIIQGLKKDNKNIADIIIFNSDPKLDEAIAEATGAQTAVRTNNANVYMIEIKMLKNTNLEKIKRQIQRVVGDNEIKTIQTY